MSISNMLLIPTLEKVWFYCGLIFSEHLFIPSIQRLLGNLVYSYPAAGKELGIGHLQDYLLPQEK